MRKRVLFVCTHNSARSPMAEAWLNHLGGDCFEAESAGLGAGTMKPLVVEAMREAGMDLSTRKTQTVFEVAESGRRFDYVVILCDPKKAEGCPVFPGEAKRLHWDIPERPKTPTSTEEQLAHDHHRTRKETTEVPESLPAEPPAHDPEVEELKTAFRRMINSLPEPYRNALTLTEFEGLTQKELAERLGISLSGGKSRVQRGKEQLKRMLLDRCEFEVDRLGRIIDCKPRTKDHCQECI